MECLEWARQSFPSDQIYQRRGGVGLPAVNSRAWLVWCLSEIGQYADAIEHGRQALQIAEAANHPASLVFAYRSVGLAHLRKGELDRAVPALERAVEVCRIADLRLPFDVAASFLGYAYALGGRRAEAVPLMERAVTDPAATGSGNHALLLAHLGEGYLLAGHPDQAVAVAQRGLSLARHQGEGANEAWVLRLLGEIAVRRDPPDAEAAERHYREALGRADALGMRPLVAHCHLGLGRLYSRGGDRAKAQPHLNTAATLYREMGMASWLTKAEAAGAML